MGGEKGVVVLLKGRTGIRLNIQIMISQWISLPCKNLPFVSAALLEEFKWCVKGDNEEGVAGNNR